MLDKLMSKSLKIFTLVSSTVTMIGFGLSFQDIKLKDKFVKLQERNEILEKQINELKIDGLKNELTKNKVEYFRTSLEESQNKVLKEVETIQKLEVKTDEQKEVLNSHLENFNSETENMQNMISEILKYFNDDNNNKFLGDSLFEFFTNYINNLNKFLSTLSFEQYSAVAHLSSAICMLVFLLSIISILFGDSIIKYFKLEDKLPKLANIFRIRSKFNKFSLFISFTVIIFNLLLIIYINTMILIF
jgi:hypothetical protein